MGRQINDGDDARVSDYLDLGAYYHLTHFLRAINCVSRPTAHHHQQIVVSTITFGSATTHLHQLGESKPLPHPDHRTVGWPFAGLLGSPARPASEVDGVFGLHTRPNASQYQGQQQGREHTLHILVVSRTAALDAAWHLLHNQAAIDRTARDQGAEPGSSPTSSSNVAKTLAPRESDPDASARFAPLSVRAAKAHRQKPARREQRRNTSGTFQDNKPRRTR